jgi:N-acetylmuramoyl-L-alanine amidase
VKRAGATVVAGLALLLTGPVPALAAARPDRALYDEAKAALQALHASSSAQSNRSEWEKVAVRFRRVVARYPQSGYCDNALLAVGDLYREMAVRFKSPKLNADAITAYRTLVAEYPSSSLGEPALHAVVEIAQAAGDRKRLTEAARAYLDAFPDAPRAREVKAALRKGAPADALPSPPPPGLARVFNLRFWSGEASTRIVIDLERQVAIRHDRIAHPDRLWVDLIGTRLHPNLKDHRFPVGDGLLEQVRVAQNRDDVVRVVLDFKEVQDYSVVYMQDPIRLVVDVRATPGAVAAALEKPTTEGAPAATPAPAPLRQTAEASPPAPTPSPAPTREATTEASPPPTTPGPASRTAEASPAPDRPPTLPTRRLPAVLAPQAASASPSPSPMRIEAPQAEPAPVAAARGPEAPQPAQVNRAGSYSLARQLGLGARRIVIDAGHGGHDPGTIGRSGLQEKDLVLDVALRLEKLVRAELGTEVVLTRASDVFVPLEERTAIANSKAADLFLSIHANSSRNASARGIETYFLNFALNPHAEEVAARENAISPATLKDLQGLVKAIALNSKIDESRDFAASVQEAMVSQLKPQFPGATDRGVHTAPFYVLIGANMPSVLAEIAFVSNPEDERLLRTSELREHIARSLLEGVRGYLGSLNRTQAKQLSAAGRPPRAATREARR